MFPCHTRVNGKDGVLYNSEGEVCTTWETFSDQTRGLLIGGIVLISITLLALGTMGIVRYMRRRNRRLGGTMEIPQRPMATMAQGGYMQHRQSKSMASTSTEASIRYMHRYRSNSVSSGSNETPTPSPLRQARYARPFSGGYEESDLGSRQPMSRADARDGPVSSLSYGGHAGDHGYSAYPSMMQTDDDQEDAEYLKDKSRRGSMTDAGHGKA